MNAHYASYKTITIRKKLESETIEPGEEAQPMLGKNVEIIIRELDEQKAVEKKWNFPGSVFLGKDPDAINIRDYAHDDLFTAAPLNEKCKIPILQFSSTFLFIPIYFL